ncbi:hypothetical protein ACT3SP_07190 [Brachybacterium sp. AOP43-C2-M15]|uniref:hypothetical protein n=1 Tax=Brachybacterium sp. AOP43-C2-M15 TaxID=3457661 RepID=UPI00403412B2
MPPLTAHVEQAARWAHDDADPPDRWNPVYRALLPAPPGGAEQVPDEVDLDLVVSQLSAPALLVVAVTHEGSTRRLRAALSPHGATLESSRDEGASTWWSVPVEQVPSAIGELLAEAGIAPASPHLTVAGDAAGLTLTPSQIAQVQASLAAGSPPEEAFGAVEGSDPRLRDALTASGPRIALSLTLHDASGVVTEDPVNWSRLWVRGELGLYRTGSTGSALPVVQPVTDGDVLGSVLPVLEQGVRFAAARDARGGAR